MIAETTRIAVPRRAMEPHHDADVAERKTWVYIGILYRLVLAAYLHDREIRDRL